MFEADKLPTNELMNQNLSRPNEKLVGRDKTTLSATHPE